MHEHADHIRNLWATFDRTTADLATARRLHHSEDAILRLRIDLQSLRIELSELGEAVEPEPVAA